MGCGLVVRSQSIGTTSVPSEYSLDNASQENSGLLIVATRFTLRCDAVDPLGLGMGTGEPGSLGSSVWPFGVLYVTNGNKTIDITAYSPIKNIRESDYHSPPGFFHVVKLPPGEYYFNKITGHQDPYSYITDNFASLPFNIQNGKATYVGEVSIAVTKCDYSDADEYNKDKKQANVKYTVTNQWNRDSRLLKNKYKNIDPSKVKLMITHI